MGTIPDTPVTRDGVMSAVFRPFHSGRIQQEAPTVSAESVMSLTPGQNFGSRRPPDNFATTRWSMVVSAGQSSSPESEQALASLCEGYWKPLYGYVRRRVSDVSEAHDLTQAFFADLLQRNFVGEADPQRGRFRAFLLTALRNFLSKEWEKQRAQKRGGGVPPISLDFASADSQIRLDPAGGQTPEQIYEREWAMTLLERILQKLGDEFSERGRADQFACLKPFLVGDHGTTTYADVAADLKLSEAAAKMAVSRMRQRYRVLLRDEIAQTVARSDDVDDEIRSLFATLGA